MLTQSTKIQSAFANLLAKCHDAMCAKEGYDKDDEVGLGLARESALRAIEKHPPLTATGYLMGENRANFHLALYSPIRKNLYYAEIPDWTRSLFIYASADTEDQAVALIDSLDVDYSVL